MFFHSRMCRWFSLLLFCFPLFANASIPVKSMVIFGDSLSDNGNTTHLLKSLRQEESPAFLVAPFKQFVLNKMIDFANDYYVPQMVLDAGIGVVTNFFDYELAPYIANLVSRVKLVPILPGKPYWNAHFSNGRVWNEYLANMFSIKKSDEEVYTNKAFGGSWAATYDHQLTVWNLIRHPLGTIKTLIVGKLVPPSLGLTLQAYFLEHQRIDNDAVYFVYSGFNDYLNILLFEDNYNPAVMSVYVDNVLENLSASVLKLAQSGASHMVIMGIPQLGELPRFVRTTDREVMNAAANLHNARLIKRVAEWKKLHPKVDFLFIDTANSFANTLREPEKFGFSNVKDACIDVKYPMFGAFANSPFANNYVLQYMQVIHYKHKHFVAGDTNYQTCDNPDGYLFWDEVHPSTRAHRNLALDVCIAMQAHGYEVNCELPDLS